MVTVGHDVCINRFDFGNHFMVYTHIIILYNLNKFSYVNHISMKMEDNF